MTNTHKDRKTTPNTNANILPKIVIKTIRRRKVIVEEIILRMLLLLTTIILTNNYYYKP